MPSLVQIGAGNIGRGFIAPIFHAAGWQITFVDVAPAIVAALRQRAAYRVLEVDGDAQRVVPVGPVAVIDGRDQSSMIAALVTCDLVATSVGLGALPRLAVPLAGALPMRTRPLDVLLCENGMGVADLLRNAVRTVLPSAHTGLADTHLGCVGTSIGRMIPAPLAGEDVLDIRVEPYCHLPVERAAFRGAIPQLPHVEAVTDFAVVLRQKLYLHNLTHAALAYAGRLNGCATIPECMHNERVVALAQGAGEEACAALQAAYGEAVGRDSRDLLAGLLKRYRNHALNDPVARVARDPWRKLAADDRLVGAARFCLAHGVTPRFIASAIALACRYVAAVDEPRAAEWNALDPAQRLFAASGIARSGGMHDTPLDPLLELIPL